MGVSFFRLEYTMSPLANFSQLSTEIMGLHTLTVAYLALLVGIWTQTRKQMRSAIRALSHPVSN
eukprot:c27057_g1_i1 orf=34-225(-)